MVSEALVVIFCSQFYTLTVIIKQFSLQTVKFFQRVSSSNELEAPKGRGVNDPFSEYVGTFLSLFLRETSFIKCS